MAAVKTVSLAYICCEPEKGKSETPPIILHHGFTSSKERWKPIQQALANESGRVVYAVDARNHGESEKSDFFNFDILTKDLEHFMETKGISKAIMIGHSMGGIVIMALAVTAPEKIEKLIVEDVSPKEPEPELYYIFGAMLEELIKCFSESTTSDTEGTIQQKIRECLYRSIPMIPDADQEVIQELKFPVKKTENGYEPLTNLKALLKAVENPPICTFPKGKSYNGNTLFIYGGQSNFSVIEDKDLILNYFPKAEFLCFEEAAHEVCSRYPEKFLKAVLKHLS